MKNTISLCMIVKNEEEVLERCLNSVKDAVEEIIVIDTGSTDRTKKIALDCGAKVYDFRWTHDFSAARNFALKKAKGDWVLQLDADEYFLPGEAIQLKNIIQEKGVEGYLLQIHNFVDEKTIGSKHTNIRLFKNVEGMIYMNPIHEMITINHQNLNVKECDVRIMHVGYIEKIAVKKKKHSRNHVLLEKELKKNPNNPAMNYYMGNEYVLLDPEKAITYYERALKHSKGTELEHTIYHFYLRALVNTGQEAKCLEIIKNSKEKYSDYTDMFLMEATVYDDFGRSYDAKELYLRCLEMGTPPSRYVSSDGSSDVIPLERLMRLALKERKWKDVIHWGMKLIEANKYHAKVVYFFHLLNGVYDETKIEELLNRLYSDQNKDDLLMKFKIAYYIRSSRMVPKLYEKMEEKGLLPVDFYYFYFKKDWDNAKKVLENKYEQTNEWEKLSILWSYETKEEILEEEKKSPTFHLMLKTITGEAVEKKGIYDEEYYLELVEECLKIRNFELFEIILGISYLFENDTDKKIAKLLLEYFHDDIAIELLEAYNGKLEEPDIEVLEVLAECYYAKEDFYQAIAYAEKAAVGSSFKPFEILLNSCLKIGNVLVVKELAKSLIKEIPDSSYLKNILHDLK